jgi:hypothetical protein
VAQLLATPLRWKHFLYSTAGFIGFFVAPVALAVHKGGPAHRLWMRVFFWGKAVSGLTAPVGAQHIHSLFLLLTALFSLYMAVFGYRSVFLKHLAWDAQVILCDWLAAGLGLVVFASTVAYGLRVGNIPVTVFGSIGAFTALQQLRGYGRAGS